MSKIKTRKEKETAELKKQIEILKAQLKAHNIQPATDILSTTKEEHSLAEQKKLPSKKSTTEKINFYDFENEIKSDIRKTLIISSAILSIILSIWIKFSK